MKHYLQKIFIATVLCIITVAVLLKIYSMFKMREIFLTPDPVFVFLPNGIVSVVAIGFESWIAYKIIKSKSCAAKAGMIVYMCIVFIAYKIGLAISGYKVSCGCFGGKENAYMIFISAQKLINISDVLLVVMLLPSLLCLVVCKEKSCRNNVAID